MRFPFLFAFILLLPRKTEGKIKSALTSSYQKNNQRSVGELNEVSPEGEKVDDLVASGLSNMALGYLKKSIPGCHFVVITSNNRSPLVLEVLRHSWALAQPSVVVDVENLNEWSKNEEHFESLVGGRANCRAFLIDVTSGNNDVISAFLTKGKLWWHPNARVVFVGSRRKARRWLRETEALKNSLHNLYLGLEDSILSHLHNETNAKGGKITLSQRIRRNENGNNQSSLHFKLHFSEHRVHLYSLCLTCGDGQPEIKYIDTIPLRSKIRLPSNLFPDQMLNLRGHRLKVVGFSYYPFIALKELSRGPSSPAIFNDCMDKRLYDAISSHLNFSFDLRTTSDRKRGIKKGDGNWTGLLGPVQYEEVDMTTTSVFINEQEQIAEFGKTTPADLLVIVSLKPHLLPQHFAILRPFTVSVWIGILLSTVVWGMSMWLTSKAYSLFNGNPGMTLGKSLYLSWSIILEDPPMNPVTDSVGRIMVCFWLLTCFVLASGYKSSLIANLTVQSRVPPIDTFQDLSELRDWEWSIEDLLMGGAPYMFFKNNPLPIYQKIYKHMGVNEVHTGLKKTLKGGQSFIASYRRITHFTESYYTNEFGESPFYFSQRSSMFLTDAGWGFRKGAPFHRQISLMLQRLTDAGLVNYWINDVLAKGIRRNKQDRKKKKANTDLLDEIAHLTKSSKNAALKLNHVLGSFLVILGGITVSFMILITEKLIQGLFLVQKDFTTVKLLSDRGFLL